MKKYMIFGTIGLILVFTVGLLTLSSLAFQIGLGADNELNSSNPTLKDVGVNPEAYLGETVMVEGYAIYYRWQSDSLGFNPFGDFWLSESIENPGNIGIWINVLDKTQPLPPGNSKILTTGIVGFVNDHGGYYRIDTQKIKILSGLITIQRATLELFTDKIAYDIGEEVILTFANHGPEDINVILPNGAPFEIEFRDLVSGEVTVSSLPAIQVLIPVPAGERVTWTLRESEGLLGSGYYKIIFHVIVEETRYTLDTNFSVGVSYTSLALFTDKDIYTEGEDVTLTFVNRDSRKVNAGYCFEISYQEQKNGPSITYGIPCIEILVILPPGDSITWVLTPTDLKGSGYYTINYSVHYDDGQPQKFQTEFVIVATDELFTDKEVYIDGENVTLTFENRASHPAYASYCFDIIYRAQETGPSTTYGLPCIEIEVIVPPGGNIAWTLTPADLKGPGHYSINYRIYRREQVEILQTEFTIWPKNSPVSTPFFIPGFGAIATIIAMLGVLLLRQRKNV